MPPSAFWPYRLTVRTRPFHGRNRGSIPRGVTTVTLATNTPAYLLLHEWQELIGAFLGPFLAVSFSVIGFLITRLYHRRSSKREVHRRIEIWLTFSLNKLIGIHLTLKRFIGSTRSLAKDIDSISNPKEFSIQSINFQPLGDIYLDPTIRDFSISSFYLHNKVLRSFAMLSGLNDINGSFGENWAYVVRQNELHIELTKDTPNPPLQREMYSDNLKRFAEAIERYCDQDVWEAMTAVAQAKTYNDKLRQGFPRGIWFRWNSEGASFKYFSSGKAFRDYVRSDETIARIDGLIDSLVVNLMAEVRKKILLASTPSSPSSPNTSGGTPPPPKTPPPPQSP